MPTYENLPFPRGQTMFGLGTSGGTITQAMSDSFLHLLGREYEVEDPDYNGEKVTLRVVRYDGTGNLTAAALGVDYNDTLQQTVVDQAPPAGVYAHPMDHKYVGKVIRDLDYFYVVSGGPCECTFLAALTAMDNCSFDSAGKIVVAQAGDNFVVGINIDAGGTNTVATINVGRNRGIE